MKQSPAKKQDGKMSIKNLEIQRLTSQSYKEPDKDSVFRRGEIKSTHVENYRKGYWSRVLKDQ